MSELGYPIRAVSKLTGLSVDTLRAWERRYQAIAPDRKGHGRMYNKADVERLILLREAVKRGHGISQLAPLSNRQLKGLAERSETLPAASEAMPKPSPSLPTHYLLPDLQTLLLAIERFDYAEIDRELNRLATLAPVRELLQQVVTPLMKQVGDRWCRGTLTIAQEHMVSSAMRNLLGTLVRLYTRTQNSTTLLFATPSGERHELGILSAAALAAGGGLRIGYLGVDLPAQEIIDVADKTAAQVVVLGVKGAINPKDSLKQLRHISEMLPAEKELWVGGTTSKEMMRGIKTTRAIYLQDFYAMEPQLIRLGAIF
ncbi:MAG: B12-binding domain-containing protein [Blastocatellia bacterium]